jgi:ankyrin repeat protein
MQKMRSLVEEGADVNGKSESGVTPLISAASGNRQSAINFLLARAADKYAKTNEGFAAFDFAAYNRNEAMARLLWIRFSAMSDAALKAAMDESRSRMIWNSCLSRRPSRRDVVQTSLDSKSSALFNRKQGYRCSDWTGRSYIPWLKKPLPFDRAQSIY